MLAPTLLSLFGSQLETTAQVGTSGQPEYLARLAGCCSVDVGVVPQAQAAVAVQRHQSVACGVQHLCWVPQQLCHTNCESPLHLQHHKPGMLQHR